MEVEEEEEEEVKKEEEKEKEEEEEEEEQEREPDDPDKPRKGAWQKMSGGAWQKLPQWWGWTAGDYVVNVEDDDAPSDAPSGPGPSGEVPRPSPLPQLPSADIRRRQNQPEAPPPPPGLPLQPKFAGPQLVQLDVPPEFRLRGTAGSACPSSYMRTSCSRINGKEQRASRTTSDWSS